MQYSHSRLSSFENCPRQFRYRYIENIKSEREGVEAFVGRRVHEILERLYHHLERHGRPPSLAQVQERFRKDWAVQWHPHIEIVRVEYDPEWYLALGLRCLENYYRGHYPFDDGETVGIEQHLSLTLDPEGRYRMRGIVDRIVRRPEGRYEIHDYKTGSMPPKSRLEKDRQLALYQIGLEQTYDDVQSVGLVWHYLAFAKTLSSARTPEQLSALRRDTIELIERIQATTEYPAKPSALCRWCDYRGVCPDARADAKALEGPPPGLEPPPHGEAPHGADGRNASAEPIQLPLL